jgi:hypothetical protein
VWYWAPSASGDDVEGGGGGGAPRVRPASRKVFLAAYRSEELKVRAWVGRSAPAAAARPVA